MIKRLQLVLTVLTLLFVLSACSSVHPDAVTKYKQENVLHVEIIVPEYTQSGVSQEYAANLTQAELEVIEADPVIFHFWSEHETVDHNFDQTVIATNVGNGSYVTKAILPQDGIYYLQVTASSDESIIMPTKRFVVGDVDLTEPDHSNIHDHTNHDNHH